MKLNESQRPGDDFGCLYRQSDDFSKLLGVGPKAVKYLEVRWSYT